MSFGVDSYNFIVQYSIYKTDTNNYFNKINFNMVTFFNKINFNKIHQKSNI